jgi:hypothetical protein
MAKKIVIRTTKELQTTLETAGFSGPECTKVSDLIRIGKKTEQHLTSEYYGRPEEVHLTTQ